MPWTSGTARRPRAELDDFPVDAQDVDGVGPPHVSSFDEDGPGAHVGQRAGGVVGFADGADVQAGEGARFVQVDGHEGRAGDELLFQRPDGRRREETRAPAGAARRSNGRVDDERNVFVVPENARDAADVRGAAERADLHRANALMEQHFTDLRRELLRRDGPRTAEPRGRLDGDHRHRRTSESACRRERSEVHRDAGAAPWIETTDRERACSLDGSHRRGACAPCVRFRMIDSAGKTLIPQI